MAQSFQPTGYLSRLPESSCLFRSSTYYTSQGTLPFLSIRLLNAWRIQAKQEQWPIIQTAIDDLESFHWLLIWAITHILNKISKGNNPESTTTAPNPKISVMLEIFSGDVSSQASKESMAETLWNRSNSISLGSLFRDWMVLFRDARTEATKCTQALSEAMLVGQERERVCNELERCCMKVYEGVLESGFKNLQEVGTYTWDKVLEQL